MRMINKIMWSMRDTGLLEGMNAEDCDTLATAALEALQIPTMGMMVNMEHAVPQLRSFASMHESPSFHAYKAAIKTALDE